MSGSNSPTPLSSSSPSPSLPPTAGSVQAACLAPDSTTPSHTLTLDLPEDFDIKYEDTGFLGEGGFGRVHKVREKSGERKVYACKVIRPKGNIRTSLRMAQGECDILELAAHPHIVAMKEHYFEESTMKFYLILEFCPGGDLFDLALGYMNRDQQMPEEMVWFYLYQMASGLHYLHNLSGEGGRPSIIHRDMKLENVLVTEDGLLKITDFGVSRQLIESCQATSVCGTDWYRAPEMVRAQPYGPAVDLWALGGMVYTMTTLDYPFEQVIIKDKFRKNFRLPALPLEYSDILGATMESLLSLKPSCRPSCDQLLKKHEIRVGKQEVEIILGKRYLADEGKKLSDSLADLARRTGDLNRERAEFEQLRREFEQTKISTARPPKRTIYDVNAGPSEEPQKMQKVSDGPSVKAIRAVKGMWKAFEQKMEHIDG